MFLLESIQIYKSRNASIYISGMRENKFGIAYEDAFDVYKKASKLESINIVGVDFHIGSQIMSISPYIDSIKSIKKLIDKLQDWSKARAYRCRWWSRYWL